MDLNIQPLSSVTFAVEVNRIPANSENFKLSLQPRRVRTFFPLFKKKNKLGSRPRGSVLIDFINVNLQNSEIFSSLISVKTKIDLFSTKN